MALEAEATSLWHFSVSVLPGLLQTPGYARELLAAGGLQEPELTQELLLRDAETLLLVEAYSAVLTQQVEARIGRRELLEGADAPPFRVILSEAVFRTTPRDMGDWREQLDYLAEAMERPKMTLQVLLFSAGMHGLDSTAVKFLRLPDSRTVAYVETAYRGELIEEHAPVEHLQRAYDAMRDLALSPAESRKFVLRMLEEVPCDSVT